jgi:hypothetical protein
VTKVRTAVIAAICLAALVAAGVLLEPVLRPPGPRPLFQLPVACGETWRLSTYPGHDDYDVDFYPESGDIWGRPIHASAAGTVIDAGIDGELGGRTQDTPKGPLGRGGGYWVKIDHGGRWTTLYLHMIEPPPVTKGRRVEMGELIGKIGSTGKSSAPHLHYEQLRAGEKTETWFDGKPSGITSDDKEYRISLKSRNCPG